MRSLQLKSLLVLVILIGFGGAILGQPYPMWETLDPNSGRPVGYNPKVGDPIYPSNGQVRVRKVDFRVSSVGFDFVFQRHYRSTVDGQDFNGPLGVNWDFNYNTHITGNYGGQGVLAVYDGDWRSDDYTYDSGSSKWLAASGSGIFDELTSSGQQVTRRSKHGFKWVYSQVSNDTTKLRLTSMQDRNGNSMSFAYDATTDAGKLTKVTDTNGRDYTFSYDSNDRITKIADFVSPTPRAIEYEYSTYGDLISVTELPGESLERVTTYAYWENTGSSTHRLITITDAKENKKHADNPSYGAVPFCRNYYDTNGRCFAQEYGPEASDYDGSGGPTGVGFGLSYTLGTGGQVDSTEVTNKHDTKLTYVFDTEGLPESLTLENGTVDPVYTYDFNADNRLTTFTRDDGSEVEMTYDSMGNLLTKTSDPGGGAEVLEEVFGYESTYNNLTRHVDANGVETLYEYDSGGRLIKTKQTGVTPNIVTSFTYDSSHGYQLSTSTDPNGVVTAYSYDSNDRLTKVTMDSGTGNLAVAKYTYDQVGNLATSKDALNRVTTYTVNRLNQVTKVTDPASYDTEYVYDANDNVVTQYVENGGGSGSSGWVVTMEYDLLDKLTKSTEQITNSTTRSITYAYDDADNLTRITDPEGRKVDYAYDDLGRNTKVTAGAGTSDASSWTYYYDNDSRLTKMKDPANKETKYYYDYHGRQTKVLDPANHFTYTEYDYGRVDFVETYASGSTPGTSNPLTKQRFFYDSLGRMTKSETMLKESPSGSNIGDGWTTTTYEYDKLGRTTSVFDENSNETEYTYDRYGRLSRTDDAAGNAVVYTYDNVSNVITKVVSETDGTTTDTFTYRYEYDDLNRLTKSYDPGNSTATLTYDPMGNVVTSEDALGNKSFFEYDELNRTTKSRTQYSGTSELTSQFFYDKSGNLLTSRDAKSYDRRFEYDAQGRMTKQWFPDTPTNKSVSYVYDSRGNVVTRTDQRNAATYFTYDDRGLMVTKTFSLPTGMLGESSHEYYFYDELGRVTKAEDSDSRVKYTYNTGGLVETEELQYFPDELTNNSGRTIEWDYNDQGLTTAIRYPGATATDGQLNYTYDDLNRLSKITRQLTSSTTEDVAEWDFRGSRIIKRTNGNGTWCDMTFDSRGRVTGMVHRRTSSEKVVEVGYGYDDAGAVVGESIVHYKNDGTTQLFDHGYSFVYDKAHRLTKAYEGVPASEAGDDAPSVYVDKREYTLDLNGNRVTVGTTPSGGSTTNEIYTVNSTNEYEQVVVGSTTRDYEYDAAGNRKSVSNAGTKQWYHDYRNKLVKVTTGGTPYTEYKYDVFGRRMCKKWNWSNGEQSFDEEEWHFYAGSAMIQEYVEPDEPVLQMEYVWGQGLGELLQAKGSETTATVHADAAGSSLALTDDTSAADIIETYRYLVHGGVTIFSGDTSDPGTPFGNKWLWKANYYDLEIESVSTGQRIYGGAYDPLIGANIQRSASGAGSGNVPDTMVGKPGKGVHPMAPPQAGVTGPLLGAPERTSKDPNLYFVYVTVITPGSTGWVWTPGSPGLLGPSKSEIAGSLGRWSHVWSAGSVRRWWELTSDPDMKDILIIAGSNVSVFVNGVVASMQSHPLLWAIIKVFLGGAAVGGGVTTIKQAVDSEPGFQVDEIGKGALVGGAVAVGGWAGGAGAAALAPAGWAGVSGAFGGGIGATAGYVGGSVLVGEDPTLVGGVITFAGGAIGGALVGAAGARASSISCTEGSTATATRNAVRAAERAGKVGNGVQRPLKAADFGTQASLKAIDGTFSVCDDVATIAIRNMKGNLGHYMDAINGLKETARAAGATSLRIEGTIANPGLLRALERLLGPPMRGASGDVLQDIWVVGL